MVRQLLTLECPRCDEELKEVISGGYSTNKNKNLTCSCCGYIGGIDKFRNP